MTTIMYVTLSLIAAVLLYFVFFHISVFYKKLFKGAMNKLKNSLIENEKPIEK